MNAKVDILVGICSARKYRDRRDAVRETWLTKPHSGCECLFFYGGEVLPEEERDTIGLDVPDNYETLPGKVLAFFRYALENYDFEWVFKCDDDTYLDLPRLSSIPDSRYGIIGDVSLASRKAPSGGAGYFLSRKIVEKIASLSDVPQQGIEDLIFGELALEAGSVPFSTHRLHLSNDKYPEEDNDIASCHWCSPECLRMVHTLRWSRADTIYRAMTKQWEDDVFFYGNGVFKRSKTSCYGQWSLDENLRLSLDWKHWKTDELNSVDENSYANDAMTLSLLPNLENLSFLTGNRLPGKQIRFGRVARLRHGWNDKILPVRKEVNICPWEDNSVKLYYLDEVVNFLSQEELVNLLDEISRTLEVEGVVRLSFWDIARFREALNPAIRNMLREIYSIGFHAGEEQKALTNKLGHRSFWAEESLSSLLMMMGFEVTLCEAGESPVPQLDGLERMNDQDGEEAYFPWIVYLEGKKAHLTGERRTIGRYNRKDQHYVSPLFRSGPRLGNRLFQIAAVYAHALRQGIECRVPWNFNKESAHLFDLLRSGTECCPNGGYSRMVSYNEQEFSYHPIPEDIKDGALSGYFQSERYFFDFEEEIRKLFSPLTRSVREGTLGVHIRMGDYVRMNHKFMMPNKEFLSRALTMISPEIHELHLFSDEPVKAFNLLKSVSESRRFKIFLNQESSFEALGSLSSMQELILSCSSFSWWAAYLGDQENVYIQKKWFSGEISDYQDIYREKWTLL